MTKQIEPKGKGTLIGKFGDDNKGTRGNGSQPHDNGPEVLTGRAGMKDEFEIGRPDHDDGPVTIVNYSFADRDVLDLEVFERRHGEDDGGGHGNGGGGERDGDHHDRDPGVTDANIGQFVRIDRVGNDARVFVDLDGAGTKHDFVHVATLQGFSGNQVKVEIGDAKFVAPVNEIVTGTSGADLIATGGGNDIIDAGAGDDVIDAGAGNDRIRPGPGDDIVAGGPGADSFFHAGAGDGLDTLVDFNRFEDTGTIYLTGAAGEYTYDPATKALTHTAGVVGAAYGVVFGLPGAPPDRVTPPDAVPFGGATETYFSAVAGDMGPRLGELRSHNTANVSGTPGSDLLLLFGSASGLTASGGGGRDRILDLSTGGNILDGGAGADTMAGGAGGDTYAVENGFDLVVESPGAGIDSIESFVNYKLSDNVENLTLFGAATIGNGNDLPNRIVGNGLDNALDGTLGADTMLGAAGGDTYFVDNGGDLIVEASGEGNDTVFSAVNYKLSDNVENLTLAGAATIGNGNDLPNRIVGNGLDNSLDGLLGADTMLGAAGGDTYFVDDAGDIVVELLGEGNDTVFSTIDYTLSGNVENLTLTGAAVRGTGNFLPNRIVGNGLDNSLDGERDADTMLGGNGDDDYRVDNAGDTVVEGFDEGIDMVFSGIDYTLGANVERLLLIGNPIIGIGNALDNFVGGTENNNFLYGLDGLDFLSGGRGADTMAGGAGGDTYAVDNVGDAVIELPGEGIDTVISTIDYTLGDDVENLTLSGAAEFGVGNALNNTITGYGLDNILDNFLDGRGGADILDGGIGDDILDGGADADTMIGREGGDTYFVDNAGDVVFEGPGDGIDTVQSSIDYTLVGVPNVENLVLTGAAVFGTGNALDNQIFGNGLVNFLDGGPGRDTMVGGASDDVYYVDNFGDIVVEFAGQGFFDEVHSSIDYTLTANVEVLFLIGDAVFGTGNELGNDIVGNDRDNTLIGLGGSDGYLVHNFGDTVVEGPDAGIDWVTSFINYVLGANVENLRLIGAAVVGSGNELGNTIDGNGVNNVLDGRLGADRMSGGAGDDIYTVDNAGDRVFEFAGEGIDSVFSSIDYTLGGNVENLQLTGAAVTGSGNELGNRIVGNGLDNFLDGGPGDDTFIILNILGSGSSDTIFNFVAGAATEDVLDISQFGFASLEDLRSQGGIVEAFFPPPFGVSTLIQLDADDIVVLLGVASNTLHADDFLF